MSAHHVVLRFESKICPVHDYHGGDGSNANCAPEGYGPCSPGFSGDTSKTNSAAGTAWNLGELLRNYERGGLSPEMAAHWFNGYGTASYLFSPGSPYNSPGNFNNNFEGGHARDHE